MPFQELEKAATESREQAQHDSASLQDVHQSKMATLKKRHKDEIAQLKAQIASFEQQLNDGQSVSMLVFILCQKVGHLLSFRFALTSEVVSLVFHVG